MEKKIVNLLKKAALFMLCVVDYMINGAEKAARWVWGTGVLQGAAVIVTEIATGLAILVWQVIGNRVKAAVKLAATLLVLIAIAYAGWSAYGWWQEPSYIEFDGYKGTSVSWTAERYVGDQGDWLWDCVVRERAQKAVESKIFTLNKTVWREEINLPWMTAPAGYVIDQETVIVPEEITVKNILGREVTFKCMLRDRK